MKSHIIRKVWHGLHRLLGMGYYVQGQQGGVTRYTPNRSEAFMWAHCGFPGEPVDVFRWHGGNTEWVARMVTGRSIPAPVRPALLRSKRQTIARRAIK